MNNNENFIGVSKASEFLGIKKNTLYSWVHKGLIPHYKPSGLKGVVLFRKSELEAAMAKGKV